MQGMRHTDVRTDVIVEWRTAVDAQLAKLLTM